MRRALAVCVLLELGCGTAQVALFPPKPKGVDQAAVEGFVCRAAFADAERYVVLRGESLADALERIERARAAVKNREGCCVGLGTCAVPATK